MIRFGLISDTHIGNPHPGYFQQEPLAEYNELYRTLATFCREEKLDFLCHAGDVIDNGSEEQMKEAAGIFRQFPCPVWATPGNHDLSTPDSAAGMPQLMPELFPEGTVDYTVIRDGLRIDFLSTNWGTPAYFWDGLHQDPYFTPEQIAMLDKGPQDLPRILVTHSPSCGLPPEQTGMEQPHHAPPEPFSRELDRLAKEKKITMILGGHNHMNVGVIQNGTALVTAPAFREIPFELKMIEFDGSAFSMKTYSLSEQAGIRLPYNYNKTHVQGRFCDRNLVLPVRR